MKRTNKFILSAIVAGFLIVGCSEKDKQEDLTPKVQVDPTGEKVNMLLPDFTQLLERAGPSVVNIQASKAVTRRAPVEGLFGNSFPEDDPFYDFWRQLGPDGQNNSESEDDAPVSYGSGFIITADGYILTNAHVINGTARIKVTLNDKREFSAKLIGLDSASDVAVLKIEAIDLPIVQIGSSSDLKVGEWVTAIGAPFGFDNTLTAGIVSAKGRSLPNDNYTPFIQTDVAINPGNSGGPLFNLKGQVVGINSRIYSGSGGFMGISFAIPIDIAMNVSEQLRTTGRVARGRLGVQVQEVNYDLAKSFGLDRPKGALVVKVTPEGPADLGKIQSGDVIIAVNDKIVESSKDLPMMIGAIAPGQTIKLGVWRKDKELATEVKLGEVPGAKPVSSHSAQQSSEEVVPVEGEAIDGLGLDLSPLTDNIKEETKLTHGLLVLNASGKAAVSKLYRGDIILSVNYKNVSTVEEFLAEIKSVKGPVPIMISRGGDSLFVALATD